MNRLSRVGMVLVLSFIIPLSAVSAPADPHRYPFDPACPWGRIADGRGMMLRCLTAEEAQRLLANTSAPPPGTSPTTGTSAAAKDPALTPTTGGAAMTSASTPVATEEVVAELVGVTAEEGELPLAQKKLSVPLDRYQACVKAHGGLQGATGEVAVKFLVRERGRAEGAVAEKFQGMTEAAAKCIADVVDRRPTGTPSAPMVGATATIRIKRKSGR